MKLSECYVLIEPLLVPGTQHFQPVGDTVAKTLDILGLDDPVVDSDDSTDKEDKGSDTEVESEPEMELTNKKEDAKRDRGMKKSLTSMQKTKII